GETCGGGGVPGICGDHICTALTCAQQGIECGPASDGCGNLIENCGDCNPPKICGGGGQPGKCGGGGPGRAAGAPGTGAAVGAAEVVAYTRQPCSASRAPSTTTSRPWRARRSSPARRPSSAAATPPRRPACPTPTCSCVRAWPQQRRRGAESRATT